MKLIRSGAAIVLCCLGFYWIVTGLGAFLISFVPPQPGARSDFAPWFLALLGIITLFLGVASLLAGVYLCKRND